MSDKHSDIIGWLRLIFFTLCALVGLVFGRGCQ